MPVELDAINNLIEIADANGWTLSHDSNTDEFVIRDESNGNDLRFDRNGNINHGGGNIENVGSANVDVLNNADLANAASNTVPKAQGDGTLSMAQVGIDPQGYTDVSSNRSKNTVYQNTTGKPIEVNVSMSYSNTGTYGYRIHVGTSSTSPQEVVVDYDENTSGNAERMTGSVIVPDTYYYEVSDDANGNATIENWFEQKLK
jgi:hypothetical protein